MMKGEGAIVFVITFLIFLAATFAYADLPPGNMISDSMGIDPTLEWSGLAVKTLLSAIFNGIVYGVVVWLIFTFGKKALKK
ncbi:MAG: hypothetical protein ACPL0C_00060 [Candidatus Bathyarchaeales archaeon]